MKSYSSFILAGVTAGWFGVMSLAVAQPPPPVAPPGDAAPAQPPPPPVAPPGDAAPADAGPTDAAPADAAPRTAPAAVIGAEGIHAAANAGLATNGASLNIHGFTVDQTIDYLGKAIGMNIQRKADTRSVGGYVDISTFKALSTNEMLDLLNKILADSQLTAIRESNMMTIETMQEARYESAMPINVWNGDYEKIPDNNESATYVILLHSLNPTEVLKDLLTLRPQDADVASNPGGNAIIMTAHNKDVRHFAQIIQALDSSGNGDLEVFLLNYADSKAIAQELKDVFSGTTSGGGGGGGGANALATIFGGGGGRGGRGGGGGGGGGGADDPKRAGYNVNAVSDDQNNAVLVSAPIDVMPGISNLITKLDIPQEDTVEIRVFPLRHADPTDIVTELTALFPDPNGNTGNQGNARGAVANVRGGRGGAPGGGAAAGGGLSDHLKKQITVSAVADARTQSVLVTASKDTMVEVEKMIDQLDENPARWMHVYVYRPVNGDVTDMQQPLTDLFGGNSRSTTTQQNALTQRATQAANNGGTLSSSSLSSSGLGGGGGGGGTSGLR